MLIPATHTLDGIKRLVYELEQGYAYRRGMYYAVRKFAEYGKLRTQIRRFATGASGRASPCGLLCPEETGVSMSDLALQALEERSV